MAYRYIGIHLHKAKLHSGTKTGFQCVKTKLWKVHSITYKYNYFCLSMPPILKIGDIYFASCRCSCQIVTDGDLLKVAIK